jgi:hypothetical protein
MAPLVARFSSLLTMQTAGWQVNGSQIVAWRAFALVIARQWRQLGFRILQHPGILLYRFGVRELLARGEKVVFMMPAQQLLPVIRTIPILRSCSFPLWSFPLPLIGVMSPNGRYDSIPLDDIPQFQIDELCRTNCLSSGCAIVKNARVLAWKRGCGDYSSIAIAEGSKLIGIATLRLKRAGKHNEPQLDICDLLVRDAALVTETLRGALAHAAKRAADVESDNPPQKVTLLVTATIQEAAAELGFTPDNYEFPFAVQVLDRSIPVGDVLPHRWHLASDD